MTSNIDLSIWFLGHLHREARLMRNISYYLDYLLIDRHIWAVLYLSGVSANCELITMNLRLGAIC